MLLPPAHNLDAGTTWWLHPFHQGREPEWVLGPVTVKLGQHTAEWEFHFLPSQTLLGRWSTDMIRYVTSLRV